jgi:hypothetical protein
MQARSWSELAETLKLLEPKGTKESEMKTNTKELRPMRAEEMEDSFRGKEKKEPRTRYCCSEKFRYLWKEKCRGKYEQLDTNELENFWSRICAKHFFHKEYGIERITIFQGAITGWIFQGAMKMRY